MSGKLLKIKKSIASTKKTKKITKAMELVSTSKMKNFQVMAANSQKYSAKILQYLLALKEEDFAEVSEYSRKIKTGKNLFILYSSDKGLCGGMNNKIFKALTSSKKWTDTPLENRVVVTIGKKAHSFALRSKFNIAKFFNNIQDKLSDLDTLLVVNDILKIWRSENIKKAYLIAPNFKSTLVFYPKVKRYLPVTKLDIKHLLKDIKSVSYSNSFYDPDSKEILEKVIEYLILNKFYHAFLELKAVEYSSRKIAMQNATKSAEEMIDNLTLKYNTARQEQITKEIIEIVSGI